MRDARRRTLRPSGCLLVLDNCERVLAPRRRSASSWRPVPGPHGLATSREPFHCAGEHEFPCCRCHCPTVDRLPPLAELAQVAAVALFVERADSVPTRTSR